MRRKIINAAFYGCLVVGVLLFGLVVYGQVYSNSPFLNKFAIPGSDQDNILRVDGTVQVRDGGSVQYESGSLLRTEAGSNVQLGGTVGAADMTLTGTCTVPTIDVTGTANADTLDVDGAANLASTLDVTGAVALTSTLSVGATLTSTGAVDANSDITVAGDLTVETESTGGNAGARNQVEGLLKLLMVSTGTGTDGSAETESYMDDTPDGEWEAEPSSDPNVTVTADTTYYRVGSKSLKVVYGTTVDPADGVVAAITPDDLTGNESVGFWLMADSALDAGDLTFVCDEDNDGTFNVPAYTSADTWQWMEIDISSAAGSTCDAAANVKIIAGNTASPIPGLTYYVDGVYKWDADDEETLGNAIIQDGVLSVMTITTGQDQANTIDAKALYTDYFIHYQSGNDAIVWMTDQSAESGVALINID